MNDGAPRDEGFTAEELADAQRFAQGHKVTILESDLERLAKRIEAKDAEIKEARREIARLGQYEHESYGLTAEVQELQAELREGAGYMWDFVHSHRDPGSGPLAWLHRNRWALSEPAVEASENVGVTPTWRQEVGNPVLDSPATSGIYSPMTPEDREGHVGFDSPDLVQGLNDSESPAESDEP